MLFTKIKSLLTGPLLIPTVLLLVGGISYGSLFSANTRAIGAGFPFLAYSFWQVFIAAIVLIILSFFTSGLPKINIVNLKVFGLVATAGLIGPLLVITSVADKLPAGVITLCAALIPAITYLLALIVRSDRLRFLSIAGVFVGFASVLFIVLPRESLPIEGSWIWVVFCLLMPVAAAINNVFGAMLRPTDAASIPMSAGTMTIAAILLFPISWAHDGLYWPTDAGVNGLIGVIWAAAALLITYTCFFEIIRRASGLFFAQLNYVVVAAGLFWAWILLGDSLSLWIWIAVALLVISLMLMNAGTARALREGYKGGQSKD